MSNKYIKNKKLKMAETSRIRSEKLSVSIICPYCSRPSNLLSIMRHFKTKACEAMKKLYLESEATKTEPKTEYYIIKQINDTIQAHLHPEQEPEPEELKIISQKELTPAQQLFNITNNRPKFYNSNE